MKISQTLSATVLIYTIILINISVFLAVIVLNNASILSGNRQVENFSTKMNNNIAYKAWLNLKFHKSLNTNGSGFVDIIWCPTNITMSGVTMDTSLFHTDTFWYCQGTYLSSNDVNIYFNTGATDIYAVEYDRELRELNSWSLITSAFSDGAVLNIGSTDYLSPDGIDDNYNSDNYNISSTGTVYYPQWYIDDDVLARKNIYGYVSPDDGYVNIFWSNAQTNDYITENENNQDGIHVLPGSSSWYISLDIDRSFDLKILEFDRQRYQDVNELHVIASLDYSSGSWSIGYIQNDGTLSSSPWYEFDFPETDYAIFLNNTATGVLLYQITWESLTGTGMYINPIQDSDPSMIHLLGNDIRIYDWKYLSKQKQVSISK